MSYPPPLYDGTTGEVSATIRLSDAEPDVVYPNGNRVHYLVDRRVDRPPLRPLPLGVRRPPSGPDAHFHKTIAESFYILSGEVSIFDGNAVEHHPPGRLRARPTGWPARLPQRVGGRRRCCCTSRPAPRARATSRASPGVAAGETMTDQERDEFMRHHDNYWVD